MTVNDRPKALSVSEFLTELGKKYASDSNLAPFWKAESEALVSIFPIVLNELPDN
jgi:hypothetical protein